MRLAVVGATGEVGRTMVRVLQEQGVRPEVIRFFASKNSAGTTSSFAGSMRQHELLSITVAPRSAAMGANHLDTLAPADMIT